MKLASFKRLFYTDFDKDSQPLIQQLSNTINPAFINLFSALNNNLTLSDNLAATVSNVNIIVDAKGNPTTTTSFSIANSNTIVGTQVIKATNNTNASIYPNSGIFISYTQSGNIVTINNITGLPAGNQFAITVVAFLT